MKEELILLPAMPCGERLYAHQIQALSDLIAPRVLVFDNRDLRFSADAVLSAAAPRFFLAGNAYGGCLAIEAAVRAPERVLGLCLMNCNAGANTDPEEALAVCARLRAGFLEEVLAEWSQVIVGPGNKAARSTFCDMVRDAGSERWANQLEASARRADHMDDLQRLDMPTLLIWGADDRFVPSSIGRSMAKRLPRSSFHEVSHCRHLPSLECPEESTRLMRAWLSKIIESRHKISI